jgi:hypothetical protein
MGLWNHLQNIFSIWLLQNNEKFAMSTSIYSQQSLLPHWNIPNVHKLPNWYKCLIVINFTLKIVSNWFKFYVFLELLFMKASKGRIGEINKNVWYYIIDISFYFIQLYSARYVKSENSSRQTSLVWPIGF